MVWIEWLADGLLAIGIFFLLVGGIGILRLPDVYTRVHAASVTDTLGTFCVLAGLACHTVDPLSWITLVKLGLILAFMWFTSPVASHALAQSAIMQGYRPQLAYNRLNADSARRFGVDPGSDDERAA